MSGSKLVNEFVRGQLRRFRTLLGLTQREIAERANLPPSSYACLEAGLYEFRLGTLYRVLGALGLDIFDVWPSESYLGAHPSVRESDVGYDSLYLKRIQEFRMNEVVMLSEAEGAALFCGRGQSYKLLLYSYLGSTFLERLQLYLEADLPLAGGLSFAKRYDEKRMVLFLKAKSCPGHVERLIDKYLTIWSTVF